MGTESTPDPELMRKFLLDQIAAAKEDAEAAFQLSAQAEEQSRNVGSLEERVRRLESQQWRPLLYGIFNYLYTAISMEASSLFDYARVMEDRTRFDIFVRERQDVVRRWQSLFKRVAETDDLTAAKSLRHQIIENFETDLEKLRRTLGLTSQ